MKPRIIIPLAIGEVPVQSPRYYARTAYAITVEKHGGIPIFLSRPSNADIAELLGIMDGLLLMGGVDLHPKLYGESVTPFCGEIDEERDRVELALLDLAQKNDIPLLGICRGIQMLNVHRGGSLYQDLPSQLPSSIDHKADETMGRKELMHTVRVSPDSKLGKVLGNETFPVNSLHHQGIRSLGRGLTATATSEDGLIEAVESDSEKFCIGVEWHPEELDDEGSSHIFDAFIQAAKRRAGKRETEADSQIKSPMLHSQNYRPVNP